MPRRDWGHAKDYVEGMWMMLQQDKPEDFVLATGKTTSVRDFAKLCFAELGIEIEFKGHGVDEKGYVAKCNNPAYSIPAGKEILAINPKYFRPTEVEELIGDASKAERILGWKPKYDLQMLVSEMMKEEIINNSK